MVRRVNLPPAHSWNNLFWSCYKLQAITSLEQGFIQLKLIIPNEHYWNLQNWRDVTNSKQICSLRLCFTTDCNKCCDFSALLEVYIYDLLQLLDSATVCGSIEAERCTLLLLTTVCQNRKWSAGQSDYSCLLAFQ